MTKQLQTLQGRTKVFSSFLDTVLDRAGITPIPDHLVEAYKKKELERAPKSDFVGRLLDQMGIENSQFDEIVGILTVVSCAVFVVGLLGTVCGGANIAYHFIQDTAFTTWSSYSLEFGIGTALFGGLCTLFVELNTIYILIGVGPAR